MIDELRINETMVIRNPERKMKAKKKSKLMTDDSQMMDD